jgi:hypothetical protein
MHHIDYYFLLSNLEKIMTKLSELETSLTSLSTELSKAKGEILDKIDTLQAELSDVALTPQAEAALNDLTVAVKAIDDIVPDVA